MLDINLKKILHNVWVSAVLIVAMLDINKQRLKKPNPLIKVLIVAMLDVNDTTMADLVSDL